MRKRPSHSSGCLGKTTRTLRRPQFGILHWEHGFTTASTRTIEDRWSARSASDLRTMWLGIFEEQSLGMLASINNAANVGRVRKT
ncbi:hypothetical protein Poly59_59890 [Rubripirellula reticaptiva]|uniref:Uncharacterized protein n=1 Tax=Rubripirellula reticaptiva TaxID=2528013 RepID=A0A5C6EEU0_9BACT|nr:hypothetical protein Poly59_59890 [Rubripirellula reticaptiva]